MDTPMANGAARPDRTRPVYGPDFRAQVVADFAACNAKEPGLTHERYAKRLGLSQSTLSKWIAAAKRRERAKDKAARKKARRRLERLDRAAASTSPSAARAAPSRGELPSLDELARELALAVEELEAARERVQILKAAMRKRLEDDPAP